MIDQLLSSGERKWGLMSGLTLLLPHGLDGQGPEHSSCRLERFLDLCDDDFEEEGFQGENVRDLWLQGNMVVANVSEPANYFHLLRMQMLNDFRKPLVVATPKKLLRYKLARSGIEEFSEVENFKAIIREKFEGEIGGVGEIRKVLVCSGKVYYDLLERRRELGVKVRSVVIVGHGDCED